MEFKENFDVIIIGGGAAGMMAAISCKRFHPEFSVAIIDRTFALGRKILVCGAGRCNITNINLADKVSSSYYGADYSFINSIFSQFGYQQIVDFFNELGIELYVERKTDIGKLFPVTNQAQTVVSLLQDEIDRLGIKNFLNTECNSVKKESLFLLNAKYYEQKTQESRDYSFTCKYLILSTGGKTYPALGANGTGYELAKGFGHSIITPVPSALPLEGKNPLSQKLQGTKMEIEVTSVIEGKKIKTRSDDVMFTQYGLTGPAILNISREISIHFNREMKNDAYVLLNFFPGKSREEVFRLLQSRWSKRPTQSAEKSLYGIFPNKIAAAIFDVANISKEKEVQNLTEEEKNKLVSLLSEYKIQITGTLSWNEAEFTAGGVDSQEIDEKTLESKKVKNLFFCGEIIDVDGDVGGFNLSWSWASGFVAGELK